MTRRMEFQPQMDTDGHGFQKGIDRIHVTRKMIVNANRMPLYLRISAFICGSVF